jgi:hypothetical protein
MQPDQQQPPQGSRITNFEWGILFLGFVFLDVLQIALDTIFIGVFVNPPIDILVGIALPIYFNKKGVKTSFLKVLAWIGIPAIEALTASAAPFWWVEIVVTYISVKLEEKVEATAVGKMAMNKIEAAGDARRTKISETQNRK